MLTALYLQFSVISLCFAYINGILISTFFLCVYIFTSHNGKSQILELDDTPHCDISSFVWGALTIRTTQERRSTWQIDRSKRNTQRQTGTSFKARKAWLPATDSTVDFAIFSTAGVAKWLLAAKLLPLLQCRFEPCTGSNLVPARESNPGPPGYCRSK